MGNLVFSASLIGDWFYNLWISLWLLLDNIVYVCINWMYRVFILVSEVDIFGGGTQIEDITKRLYLIVGIAMLFIFAYNLILLIINPEGNQLGNMGKVIQNALISIILVTLLPLIFSYMTTIQSHIIKSNVIGNLILGTSNDPNAITYDNKKAGVGAALSIFSAFYHPPGESKYSCENGGTADLCSKYVTIYDDAYENDDITGFIWNDDLKDGLKKGDMEYTYFLSTAAGVFALWMFISFGLDIGIRVGKLAFYQLISPIPVMMRILPGDKMFGKWFSGLKDTYISLFVRLAVIYFCMYAITLVPKVFNNMGAGGGSGESAIIIALANVVVILGILKFAQEAPKLIGDLFGGGGGGLNFGIAKKVTDNKLAMGGLGMMRGGFGSASRNMFKSWRESGDAGDKWYKRIGKTALSTTGGLFGGAKRGASAGYGSSSFKDFRHKSDASIEETTEKRKERASYRALHPGFLGSTRGHIKDAVVAQGIWTGADKDRDIIDKVQYEDKVIKSFDEYKSIYNDGDYQGMDSKMTKLKSDLAAATDSVKKREIQNQIDELKNSMTKYRIEKIRNNQGAAAYAVYQISQAINSDPGMFAKLGNLNLADDQIKILKSLKIEGNEVKFKDASGTVRELSGDDLTKLLESATPVIDPATGDIIGVTETRTPGLNSTAIKKAKKENSNDKGSVVYKNQMRIEEERKNKNG